MNCFLKSRQDVLDATNWLQKNGFTTHPISCKDWELKKIVETIYVGPLLDMGADGSFVLHNAMKKGIEGELVGVDLAPVVGINKAEGATYYQADLMDTGLPDETFRVITCQSVIEHQVDYARFAKEASRLLKIGGTLIVSFDYWSPKPDTTKMKLYSLDWNILDANDVLRLILEMQRNGLEPTGKIDWTLGEAVINPSYCSPAAGVSYTFGILSFVKK